MKKGNENTYRNILDAYVNKDEDKKPEAKAKQPKAKRQPSKRELTGDALQASLSEESQALIQLRNGRKRKKELQAQGVFIRTSFVLRALYVEKFRAIAVMENVTLKDVIEEAFRNAIDTYEQKHGEIVLSEIHRKPKKTAEGIFS